MIETRTADEQRMADAQAYYDCRLKRLLEPSQNGRMVTIDPAVPDYAISDNAVDGYDELIARGCAGPFVLLRIGSPFAFEMLTPYQ
jgi:hypothetical protein